MERYNYDDVELKDLPQDEVEELCHKSKLHKKEKIRRRYQISEYHKHMEELLYQ